MESSSKDPQGHLNTYKVLSWQKRLNQPPSSHRSARESSCGSSWPPLSKLKSLMDTRIGSLSLEVGCNKHLVHTWRLCLLTSISWVRRCRKSLDACTDTIWTLERKENADNASWDHKYAPFLQAFGQTSQPVSAATSETPHPSLVQTCRRWNSHFCYAFWSMRNFINHIPLHYYRASCLFSTSVINWQQGDVHNSLQHVLCLGCIICWLTEFSWTPPKPRIRILTISPNLELAGHYLWRGEHRSLYIFARCHTHMGWMPPLVFLFTLPSKNDPVLCFDEAHGPLWHLRTALCFGHLSDLQTSGNILF